MPERRVSITEAKTRLSALVNRVAYSHERVILESHGRPKAALVSLEDLHALESGSSASRLATARSEGLHRIAALSDLMRKAMTGRALGNIVEELATLREARDAGLGRLR